MKMVHLISWKEYQDIVLKLRSGDENISLPNPGISIILVISDLLIDVKCSRAV